MSRALALIGVILLLVVPIEMRPLPPKEAKHSCLIIISPHDAQTRLEFGRAFADWAARELHEAVSIDWRTPGGTKTIQKLIKDSVRSHLAVKHPEWSTRTLDAITDAKSDTQPNADPTGKIARATFLADDGNIFSSDWDLWWGGGVPPHREFAEAGYTVDAGLVRERPDWFRDDVIPQAITGEDIYDPKGRFYGTCLSCFGICSSPARLALMADSTTPNSWKDLGDSRFFSQVSIVDPTKSAASLSAFGMLIQQEMERQVAVSQNEKSGVSVGWVNAMTLIKRIAANSRSLTDGANIAVREVARGDATTAMCIDFQARAEAAYALRQSGELHEQRLRFVAPSNGTSVSADPISLLRGAPHRKLAVDFIRFVLSPEGQRLYCYRAGTQGGPVRWELYRAPVRKDVYTPHDIQFMTDPDLNPFHIGNSFTIHPRWTNPWNGVISAVIRSLVLDPHDELTAAWEAIIRHGGPVACPSAWKEFTWLPFTYDQFPEVSEQLSGNPLSSLTVTRKWTVDAQRHYREALNLAESPLP